MNITFTGTLFDGETLATRPISLIVEGDQLVSQTPETFLAVALEDLRVSDRLASLPRYLYLPDGRTIETPVNTAIDSLLAEQQRGRVIAVVHWLENRTRVAAAATVLLVATVAATIWWGLPVLARNAAMAVPPSIEKQAGQAALLSINRLLAPSQLKFADKARADAQLARLLKARPLAVKPELVFRSMGGKFPNAFALPGGQIVVSDELVALANDEEVATVLAHEIGHWQLRHGLQGILRNSAALLVVSTVTGDLSTLTTFAGTIPFALLQRGYSREFEEEADTYAVDLIRQARIDVAYFASVLKKLENARPNQGQDLTYLSTHPATGDRIRRINPDGHLPPPIAAHVNAPSSNLKSGIFSSLPLNALVNKKEYVDFSHGGIPPKAVRQTPPVYPPRMASKSVEGRVMIEFIIDSNGDVVDPHLIFTNHEEFVGPAIVAIRQWKFSPGELNGHKVATRANQSFEFNLDDQPGRPASATSTVTLKSSSKP